MPTRIRPPQRIVEHITIAIERLRVVWSPRAADLLPLLGAELEPERLPVLAVQGCGKAGLVEPNRQGFTGHAVHTAAGAARRHGVRAEEAAKVGASSGALRAAQALVLLAPRHRTLHPVPAGRRSAH